MKIMQRSTFHVSRLVGIHYVNIILLKVILVIVPVQLRIGRISTMKQENEAELAFETIPTKDALN